jgi:hypothetical protein
MNASKRAFFKAIDYVKVAFDSTMNQVCTALNLAGADADIIMGVTTNSEGLI